MVVAEATLVGVTWAGQEPCASASILGHPSAVEKVAFVGTDLPEMVGFLLRGEEKLS